MMRSGRRSDNKRDKLEITVLKSVSSLGSNTTRTDSSNIIGTDTAILQYNDTLYLKECNEFKIGISIPSGIIKSQVVEKKGKNKKRSEKIRKPSNA